MASANYDHPSFITRQMESFGKTTAGASGTSVLAVYPTAMRVRRVSASITTVGTSSGAGAALGLYAYDGTTTTTASATLFTLGSSTVNTMFTSADLNFAVPAGGMLFAKNGTDASSVVNLTAEIHLDPTTASW